MTGQELKSKILLIGKSQKDIADLLGVSAQSLSSVLSAKDVRSGTIEKIANALNVPISFLYGEKDNEQNAVASGDSSIAVNNITGNIEAGDTSALQERVKLLEQLLAERERIIEEKERTIKILMQR